MELLKERLEKLKILLDQIPISKNSEEIELLKYYLINEKQIELFREELKKL